jgi:hypothetical protein
MVSVDVLINFYSEVMNAVQKRKRREAAASNRLRGPYDQSGSGRVHRLHVQ